MKEKWKKIYSKNRKLMYEGFTYYGLPHGSGTSYYENGNKCQEGVFDKKGLVYGREYYQNGNIRFEGAYTLHKGYGPNYPTYGTCYDEDGNEIFHGQLTVRKGGVGYPTIVQPEEYGPIPPHGEPDFRKRTWPVDDKVPNGCFYVNVKGQKQRLSFIEFLEKNGFKCEDDGITTRESTVESRYPIKIDFDCKEYGHIQNTTCAAAAASSNRVFSPELFICFF